MTARDAQVEHRGVNADPSPAPPVDWDAIDWSKSIEQIALETGVDPVIVRRRRARRANKRIRTVRAAKSEHRTKSKHHAKARPAARQTGLEQVRAMDTSHLTVDEISDLTGLTLSSVRNYLYQLDRKIRNGGYRRKPMQRNSQHLGSAASSGSHAQHQATHAPPESVQAPAEGGVKRSATRLARGRWRAVDWSQSNMRIARRHGATTQEVRKARRNRKG